MYYKIGDLVRHREHGVGIILEETWGYYEDGSDSCYIVLFGIEHVEVHEFDITKVKK
jgi:hypothetical protein